MKIIIVIILVFSFTFISCTQENSIQCDKEMEAKLEKIFLYQYAFSDITDLNSVVLWINKNIKYKQDKNDIWQSPEYTVFSKTGDCEDICLLYMNILYTRFGINTTQLCLVKYPRSVEKGGDANHALVRFIETGKLIDPQTGIEVECEVSYSYDFDDIFLKDH